MTILEGFRALDLIQIRKQFDLTQEQMAEELGVSRSQVAMLESGTRRVPPKLAKKIEKLFGLDSRPWKYFDPEIYYAAPTRENWRRALVSLGCMEANHKDAEGYDTVLGVVPAGVDVSDPLDGLELVFERNDLDTGISYTTWKEIFGDQPSGWRREPAIAET